MYVYVCVYIYIYMYIYIYILIMIVIMLVIMITIGLSLRVDVWTGHSKYLLARSAEPYNRRFAPVPNLNGSVRFVSPVRFGFLFLTAYYL